MKHPDRSPQKSFQRLNLKELGLDQYMEQKTQAKPTFLRRVKEQIGALLNQKKASESK